MEKILPFDKPSVAQETGHWCGPASAQIVLASRGIFVPETELAREIGTHTGGTDHIGWIVDRTLKRRVPEAGYQAVPLRQDPPTKEQRDLLWERIIRSIDAGWGLVQNWVAPPSNYPRAVKGSRPFHYSGGTIYHYVTLMGYDTREHAVFIIDPGFSPFWGWISAAQNATLIPPKDYAWPSAVPALKSQPAQRDPLDILIACMGNTVSRDRYRALLPHVQKALVDCQCNNVNRISMWMAQCGHESVGLKYFRELWGPTPDQMTYEGRKELGNTQPGDGRKFLGRGPIQLTGRLNYTRMNQWAFERGYVSSPTLFVNTPEKLEEDQYSFLGVIWYWTVARSNLNTLSDAKDLEGATRAINGGLNGLPDRRNRWNHCLSLGNTIMGILPPTTEEAIEKKAEEKVPPTLPLETPTIEELARDVELLKSTLLDLVPSQSRYAHDNEDRWNTVQLIRNIDAMIHEEYAERLALLGDPWHIQRIARNARRGDRTAHSIFKRIDPKALQELGIEPSEVEQDYQAAEKDPIEYED